MVSLRSFFAGERRRSRVCLRCVVIRGMLTGALAKVRTTSWVRRHDGSFREKCLPYGLIRTRAGNFVSSDPAGSGLALFCYERERREPNKQRCGLRTREENAIDERNRDIVKTSPSAQVPSFLFLKTSFTHSLSDRRVGSSEFFPRSETKRGRRVFHDVPRDMMGRTRDT